MKEECEGREFVKGRRENEEYACHFTRMKT